MQRVHSVNPFSTRFIRPGVLEYVFPTGVSAATLVDSLRRSGWQGQIVGPHGSGKSTLVRTLVPALSAAERSVVLFVLPPNERPHTSASYDYRSWDSATQVIVDGYEQLGWRRRCLLRWRCRGTRAGLLVTSHRETGLPDLWGTQTTVALAERLVAQLLRDGDASWLTDREVARTFAANQGNMRETLFALYDVFEARTPSPAGSLSRSSSSSALSRSSSILHSPATNAKLTSPRLGELGRRLRLDKEQDKERVSGETGQAGTTTSRAG